jgi:predicted outer membrane protein
MHVHKPSLAAAVLAAAFLLVDPVRAAAPAAAPVVPAPLQRNLVTGILADWPEGPRLAGEQMMAEHGPPDEATPERIVWHDAGPFERIAVTRNALPHNFPRPHMDYLEHTVGYRVPLDKVDDVLAFDGGLVVDRLAGELSARGDLESDDILALNLAADVASGKRTAEQARHMFGDIVTERTLGEKPPYAARLLFRPPKVAAAASPDHATLPGAAKRAQRGNAVSGRLAATRDGVLLATLIALDRNEVRAAMTAERRLSSGPVHDYAHLLHVQHGNDLLQTAELARQIGIAPVETPQVQRIREQGEGRFARIVPLRNEAFAAAFVEQMVQGHQRTLAMLDRDLAATRNPDVQERIAEAREHVAMQLREARQLQQGELEQAPFGQ